MNIKIKEYVLKFFAIFINKNSKDSIKLNFTDNAERIDTGRIGQFVGLISLSIITYYTLYVILWGQHISMVIAALSSAMAAIPLALYRLKEFSGLAGTAFVRQKTLVPEDFLKESGFFKKNFTDEWGRIDTGRIGQFLGLGALTIIVSYIIYLYTYPFFNDGQIKTVNVETLALLVGDSAYPMLLYRLKTFTKIKLFRQILLEIFKRV